MGIAVAVVCALLLSQAAVAGRDRSRSDVAGRAMDAGSTVGLTVPRFSTPASIDAGTDTAGVVAADLNSDGKADIVTAGARRVSVMFGDGTGQFGRRFTYRAGRAPAGIVASDLNRDGMLDLAVTDLAETTATPATRKSIVVFINSGSGRFRRSGAYAAGPRVSAVAAGDVNGDRIIDLISTNAHWSRRSFAVLLGRRAGGFRVAYRYRGGWTNDIAVADLSSDGKLDVVLAQFGAVSVRLGAGDGTFGRARL